MRSLFSGLAVALLALIGNHSFAVAVKDATPNATLDPRADINSLFAFRSYDADPTPRVTLILCVDRFAEPGNAPGWFPFDPNVLYEFHVDNNNDAVGDISIQFRFTTLPIAGTDFQAYVGAAGGVNAPGNSPAPIAPGTQIIPAKITSFDSLGLRQLQSYTVTVIAGRKKTVLAGATPFYAVPPNAGPRTMDYAALFTAGTHTATTSGVKVFAGAVDDPTWLDLGGFGDTLNFRTGAGNGFLSPGQDAGAANAATDTHSGYAVNAIAIELPVTMLTKTGANEAAASAAATIGVWGTTSRPSVTARKSPLPPKSGGAWKQVQRMGNPFVKDLLLGLPAKDRFDMDLPKKDAQFASYFTDPLIARFLNALTGGAVAIPAPPRADLLPLFTYAPPIAAAGTTPGPTADLLRLNTGITPVSQASASRLGILGGDTAGFPNGHRLFDDVFDITLRVVAGGVLAGGFNVSPNSRLGDGVNVNDAAFRTTFPYLGDCPSGRDRRHLDPGEAGGGGL
ncbi:MAG: DUF4331 domain-containing protein [Chthoniobacteraceae bacterium]